MTEGANERNECSIVRSLRSFIRSLRFVRSSLFVVRSLRFVRSLCSIRSAFCVWCRCWFWVCVCVCVWCTCSLLLGVCGVLGGVLGVGCDVVLCRGGNQYSVVGWLLAVWRLLCWLSLSLLSFFSVCSSVCARVGSLHLSLSVCSV